MTVEKNTSPTSSLCARVFDRLVETGEVDGDPELEAHLGSCMACFRTLAELRDASRLAALMREAAPAVARDERAWTEAADRTTDAVMAALRGTVAPARARRVWSRVAAATTATAIAAVAAFAIVMAGRGRPAAPGATSDEVAAIESARLFTGDDLEEEGDVGDLDVATLRRLIERLRTGAPEQLAALSATEPGEGADMLVDDDARLSDELADLDQDALARVERSLAGSAL
jgi:hypothetical protein